jgi:DNA-binding PadR family transcriptional regulator
MNKKLIECLANPVKHKLLMAIHEKERATTKELGQVSIPPATLCRYLKKMVSDGLIEVVSENQIRNVREKVYGLAIDLEAELEKIADDKSGATFLAQYENFSNGIKEEFEVYLKDNDIPEKGFAFGFGMLPIHVTNKEAWELYKKIEELLQPYCESPNSEEKELRNFAMIFTPPAK